MRDLVLLMLLMLSNAVFASETQVSVAGLFSGKAILVINGGKPKTLSVGQSVDGVKLVAADSEKAVVEIDGKRKELGMGQGVSVAGGGPSAQRATLYANNDGHFFGDGYINGFSVKFLVDTGASDVAISSDTARRIGLNYLSGDAGVVHTAGGAVKAYRVSLNTLKVGAIVLHQVEGVVLEGNSPPFALLGMSVLNRMEMQRDGMVMTLTKKY